MIYLNTSLDPLTSAVIRLSAQRNTRANLYYSQHHVQAIIIPGPRQRSGRISAQQSDDEDSNISTYLEPLEPIEETVMSGQQTPMQQQPPIQQAPVQQPPMEQSYQNPEPAPQNTQNPQESQIVLTLLQQVQALQAEIQQMRAQPSAETPRNTVKLRDPAEFDGNTHEAREFVMDCDMYLDMNPHIYNDDTKKIIYVLSHMRKGNAAAFKEHVVLKAQMDGGYSSYANFKELFEQSFLSSDTKAEAMMELTQLKQTGSADAYVNDFKMKAARAQLKDEQALLQYFLKGLHRPLVKTMFQQATIPQNINN